MNKTRADLLEDLKDELWAYCNFQERRGIKLTFSAALLGHREQVLENMRDDTDPLWRDRLGLLDQLCKEEGV